MIPIMTFRLAENAKDLQNSKQTEKMTKSHADLMMLMARTLRERQAGDE